MTFVVVREKDHGRHFTVDDRGVGAADQFAGWAPEFRQVIDVGAGVAPRAAIAIQTL